MANPYMEMRWLVEPVLGDVEQLLRNIEGYSGEAKDASSVSSPVADAQSLLRFALETASNLGDQWETEQCTVGE